MRARWAIALAATILFLPLTGCLTVQAPERIEVGSRSPEPVDSKRLPATSSHADCRSELEKAYQNIQWLESENEKLREKAARYKDERDRCKDDLERHEDRYDD